MQTLIETLIDNLLFSVAQSGRELPGAVFAVEQVIGRHSPALKQALDPGSRSRFPFLGTKFVPHGTPVDTNRCDENVFPGCSGRGCGPQLSFRLPLPVGLQAEMEGGSRIADFPHGIPVRKVWKDVFSFIICLLEYSIQNILDEGGDSCVREPTIYDQSSPRVILMFCFLALAPAYSKNLAEVGPLPKM